MNNKYFTPDIADIRVGYEYESHRWNLPPKPDEWEKMTWGESKMMNSFDMAYFRELCRDNKLRVPYLTKEQILELGWYFHKEDEFDWYFSGKDDYNFFYRLIYSYVEKRLEIKKVFKTLGGDRSATLYDGPCKDKNTFKYICKLLNIQ